GLNHPLQATGYQRVSRRKLDTARSTESEPLLLMQGAEPLAPGEVVPVEIAIWATAIRFNAGETLQVTVAPHHPFLLSLPFGSARISIAKDQFTYRQGDAVEMVSLGSDAEDLPSWVAEQSPPLESGPNAGTHVIHVGGRYDSHLLVPLRRV